MDWLVVADDNDTYTDEHVLAVVGWTQRNFWVIDPVIGGPTVRSHARVLRSASTAFSVFRRGRPA